MQSAVFQVGFQAIAEALGLAAVKAAVAITAIIAGGRLVSFTISKYLVIWHPIYIHHFSKTSWRFDILIFTIILPDNKL